MRLLIVLSSTGAGGAERMTITLANQLARQVSLRLVVGWPGPLDGEIDAAVDRIDLDVTRMRAAVLPLRRILRDWAPAVVFAPQLDAATPLAMAWRLAGRPGALVLRESNYRSGPARPRRSDLDLAALGIGWAYRQAAFVIAPAHAIARDVAARFGLPPGRVRTVYNPVDVARIRRAAAGGAPPRIGAADAVACVAVGRLVRQKGFDLLIDAFARTRCELSATAMTLTILGEGPDRDRLERQTARLGLAGLVRLPGVTSHPHPVVAGADLFVLSSRWEGCPNALIEAMALGVPPVACQCPGGADEIVEDGVSGLLCEPASPPALAAALTRLAGNARLRAALGVGAAARARVFDAPSMAGRYLDLFAQAARVEGAG